MLLSEQRTRSDFTGSPPPYQSEPMTEDDILRAISGGSHPEMPTIIPVRAKASEGVASPGHAPEQLQKKLSDPAKGRVKCWFQECQMPASRWKSIMEEGIADELHKEFGVEIEAHVGRFTRRADVVVAASSRESLSAAIDLLESVLVEEFQRVGSVQESWYDPIFEEDDQDGREVVDGVWTSGATNSNWYFPCAVFLPPPLMFPYNCFCF